VAHREAGARTRLHRVFDRSHYEDVLIGRVRALAPAEEIERRYDAIVAFEKGSSIAASASSR
jgi:polyphosphate kinase 2 (PPK2 family)